MILVYLGLFVSAALLSLVLSYAVRGVALRLDIVDKPDRRKMHPIPIPLMGGLAIFLSFAAVSSAAFILSDAFDAGALRSFQGLMAGATVIVLLGLYDDIRKLSPLAKFFGQTVAALVVVAMGGKIDLFTNPLGSSVQLGWLGIPITVFWIVGVTNAVNLIDGLDGLASGIGSIAAFGLFAVAAGQNAFVAFLSLILAGAAIGFLRNNFYPAKIFLGDTGSMFIGFALAVISLHGSFKATTATVLFLPIIVLGVPIFDTLLAIFRRAKGRVSPFKADRQHIHHRLVRIGLHHRNVVLVMYFVCAYLALTAYSIAQFPYQTAFLFLVLLTMGGIIGLRTLQFIEERLETGMAERVSSEDEATGRNAAGGSKPFNGRKRNGAGTYSALICDVGGFREGFGTRSEIESLSADLSGMLSRRVRVESVIAETSAPGHLFLLLKTEQLKPAMEALVRDGLAWYLEDHRSRFSDDASFPRIHWIRANPEPSVSGADGGVEKTAGSTETRRLSMRGERATIAGS